MTPLALFLLGCAMIYVGTVQAAFSALMRLSLRLMAERAGRSELLDHYLEDPPRLFIPARILLGLMLVLSAELFSLQIGLGTLRGISLVLFCLAAFVIVCEHLVPQLIARGNPQAVLEVLLPSFRWIETAVSPITALLLRVAERRERATASGETGERGDEGVDDGTAGREEEHDEAEERRLLRSIVDFGDLLVREVMTPRPDIVAIPAEATIDELRAFFREQEYSRIPVYQENLDNILGFAFVKDLIKRAGEPGLRTATDIMRPAYFVPETKRVPELLKEFQQQQVQSAIVVDEYGGTAGLVSLEDLLEEIVGEIRDEYDVETEPIVDEGGGSFVFSGKVGVGDLAERLGIDVAGAGFETVGGFLLSHLGRVPGVGESLEIDGLTVEVLEAERRRVHRVRVRRTQPAVPADV
ncbi:MAG: hemolysin family protein [Acidobacteria bacterium]|nr:hemolysin family protein [Acidobacteriota bacterium]